MKKTISYFLIIICIWFVTISCNEHRTGIIDVKFNTELIKSDLDQLQKDLKSKNIDLTYSHLEFDDQGYLKKISAEIDYNDGHEASFTSRELQPSDAPGFYRDFSK